MASGQRATRCILLTALNLENKGVTGAIMDPRLVFGEGSAYNGSLMRKTLNVWCHDVSFWSL